MYFRHRRMTPKDLQECVQIIEAHPIISARYGAAIDHLRSAWLRLLRAEAVVARVFEAVEGTQARICFVGVSLFVTDDFIRELKAPPLFWFGPELAKRIARGDSPVLADKAFRDANACGGLNAIVWEGCPHPDFKDESELARFVLDAYIETHRGFLLRELIPAQAEGIQRLEFLLKTGAYVWDPDTGRYNDSLPCEAFEFLSKPHLLGVTRELEDSRGPWGVSWVGKLFEYRPPRCGFSRSEQRLLDVALSGAASTNEELARALGVGLPTVKKLWGSIYRRVTDTLAEFSADASEPDQDESAQGKEKKRRLLAYIREHPEELRPVSHERRKSSTSVSRRCN